MPLFFCEMKEELQKEYELLSNRYQKLKQENLKLDMSRGKPSKLQLDLVSDLLTVLTDPAQCMAEGTDCRNYGEVAGRKCAREYWISHPAAAISAHPLTMSRRECRRRTLLLCTRQFRSSVSIRFLAKWKHVIERTPCKKTQSGVPAMKKDMCKMP